jgi:epoxide hydrolase-like predicted phosphatase
MIKNIVFDFGAVLLPINESLTWKALQELGATEELKAQTTHFRDYETGKLSTKKFIENTRPFFFRKKIFADDLTTAWNAMLYHPLEDEKVNFLKKLRRKGYRLFLLSNTNEMHIRSIRETAGPFLYKRFTEQFEKIYYSYDVGMRKPDSKLFRKVLSDHGLKVEETFFIDDKEENIQAAEKLGMKTWCFNPAEDDILKLAFHLK